MKTTWPHKSQPPAGSVLGNEEQAGWLGKRAVSPVLDASWKMPSCKWKPNFAARGNSVRACKGDFGAPLSMTAAKIGARRRTDSLTLKKWIILAQISLKNPQLR